jgi:hypothetical protein
MVERWHKPNHPPETGRLPFVSPQYRAMTSAIREELRAIPAT